MAPNGNRNYRNQQGQRAPQGGGNNFPGNFQGKWITEGSDKDMINYVEDLGKYIAKKGVTSSQLRNFYGEILRIKLKGFDKEKASFQLLKPKLAYNVERVNNNNAKEAFKNLYKVFSMAMGKVETEENFENFHKFVEAIIAYHKYYGGKN